VDAPVSRVLEFGCLEPSDVARETLHKLKAETDSFDLAEDLRSGCTDIVVLDVRTAATYAREHIAGAISFPHHEMNEASTRRLDRGKVYVVYCDGIGCNGSTKAAYKLASLGFRTKELIGGIDWWRRDGHSTVVGMQVGHAGVLASEQGSSIA